MNVDQTPAPHDRRNVPWSVIALAYTAMIVYGSLYPFADWSLQTPTPFHFLMPRWPARISRVDVITNVIAYVPLGLLLVLRAMNGKSRASSALMATIAGAALSITMEFLQQFLPGRVTSLVDVATNVLGTLAGALLASFVRADSPPGRSLLRLRAAWFLPGRLADLGLGAIGLWLLSQLTPLVPSLDIGNLRQGVAPLWRVLQQPSQFNPVQCAVYFFSISGLALLAKTLGRPGRTVLGLYFAFVACVMLLKIPVITRQLSLEAVAGTLGAAALVLFMGLRRTARREDAWIGAAFILCGFAVSEWAADGGGATHPFNWMPFRGQLENTLIGFASILESLWPAAALAYLVRYATPKAMHAVAAIVGGVALAAVVTALEWHQQFIPGRFGDFTVAVLMAGTWFLLWWIPLPDTAEAEAHATPYVFEPRSRALRAVTIVGVLAVAVAIAFATLSAGHRPVEVRVDESKLPQLPAPHELPPVRLPRFRVTHPHLPAPEAADLANLRAANPGFLRAMRARADGGRGEFGAVTFQAFVEPGSVDLDPLFRRLMELKFSWRGHEQVMPLAAAYDWLYPQWSDTQRARLQDKLAQGCDYVIERIRKERLSPYNVILYNAPLQALMACALAIYGDDPRGDDIMRFNYDLWKNRVLPAWRQVMGRNGGWHEGGEYVGIGIGQAIYEVPAMWRHATGEDLLATEPGLRGFLDFLVYRTRPDGTHFRWGDAAAFDRVAPDAIALALELRHAAAYSLRGPRGAPTPTSWPWGPLTDATLLDSTAIERLPLVRYFDGIGMVVMRSDWSADATYVTFKAGDNFWSHVHLDQGAFTIYKGGELAIDSGLYGPTYGSDHHMNYTYQTIAHNTVTVTDPDDNVPAPTRKEPRPIANDGGQRRIGSGWGVEPAPLDREEWEAKRDIYHTATMAQVVDEDGITVAVADVTPAYTNSQSGNGTFSHRTRRVERFWRTFGYDRVDDVVVVFDQVVASRPSFAKRWLLHTLEAPVIAAGGFTVTVAPGNRTGHGGGRLEGRVLLPKGAEINRIGGRGFEFFVDNKNYDEDGTLQATIAKPGIVPAEPGAWRIEIRPPRDAAEDLFLVVLLPTAGDTRPTHSVRLLESGDRIGCEIVGPTRTARWWFRPGQNGAEFEVSGDGGTRRHVVQASILPVPEDETWYVRVRKWLRLSP